MTVDPRAAEHAARMQRWGLRTLLHVDSSATAEDLAVAKRVIDAPTPTALDEALARPEVNSLFLRDVITVGGAR